MVNNDKDADIAILDLAKDKKKITTMKKGKKQPKIVSIQLILEGILLQKLDFEKHTLI